MCVFAGSVPGMRPAEAGEFTRRAFQEGKMGLTEVGRSGGAERRELRQKSSGFACHFWVEFLQDEWKVNKVIQIPGMAMVFISP